MLEAMSRRALASAKLGARNCSGVSWDRLLILGGWPQVFFGASLMQHNEDMLKVVQKLCPAILT